MAKHIKKKGKKESLELSWLQPCSNKVKKNISGFFLVQFENRWKSKLMKFNAPIEQMDKN